MPSLCCAYAILCNKVVFPTCLGPVTSSTGNILDTRAIVSSTARLIYVMTISPFGYNIVNFIQNIRLNQIVTLL